MSAELFNQSVNFLNADANRSTAVKRQMKKKSVTNVRFKWFAGPRIRKVWFFKHSAAFGWNVATFQLQPTYLSLEMCLCVGISIAAVLCFAHAWIPKSEIRGKNKTKSYQSFILWAREYLILNWFLCNQKDADQIIWIIGWKRC